MRRDALRKGWRGSTSGEYRRSVADSQFSASAEFITTPGKSGPNLRARPLLLCRA